MALIDRDELLKRYGLDKATKYGNKDKEQQDFSYDTMFMYEIADMIEDAPTVDAVEVVRCKDCKYNNDGICCYLTTRVFSLFVKDADYCKWGEKNE